MADSLHAQVQQARRAGFSDEETLRFLVERGLVDSSRAQAALQNGFGPAQVLDHVARTQPRNVIDRLKDSPAGGIVRGVRDVMDGSAQLVTRGLEAVAPEGSRFQNWARSERERVEGINREAERDYRDNWRRGSVDDSFDWGRLGGNIAGTLPSMALTGPIGPGVGTGALLGRGAVQGGAAAAMMPVNEPEEPFWSQKAAQTAVGAAGGAAGGYLAPKLAYAIQGGQRNAAAAADAAAHAGAHGTLNARGGGSTLGRVGPDPSAGLNEAQRRLADRAPELGFTLTPGQASGSRSLQQMEARMESNPFFSGPFNSIKSMNQTSLNRHAANAIGETADVLDSAVLGRAEARLGQIFDDVGNSVPRVVPQDDIAARLAAVEREFDGLLPKPLLDVPLVRRFFDQMASGEMTGAQLRKLSSQMGRAGKNAMTSAGGDRELGQAYFAVKDVVDDILGESLDPALRSTYDAARQQYRNLMLLTTRPNVVNPSSGNVSGVNLAAALQAKDRGGFLFGRNTSDFYDSARFAQAFKPIVGDSGTATRSMEMSPMSMLMALPTNTAAHAYASGPVTRLASGAAAGVAPNRAGDAAALAVQRALPLSAGVGLYGLLTD